MASDMSPDTAAQRKSLLAQQNKRLLVRLTAWGGVAVLSLVAAVAVSQTGEGSRRLEVALFGSAIPEQGPTIPVATAVPLPSNELIALTRATQAVKRATDLTAAKLAAVERNTEAARAETKRLSDQVSKLSADSVRVTGRLTSIESQVGTITGSIKRQAEAAAADAVAKAMPKSPFDKPYDRAFDLNAPVIGPPATTYPKLSLIVPKGSGGSPPDVTTTSSITTPLTAGPKDQERIESKIEASAVPKSKAMMKAEARGEELKAEAGPKAMAVARPRMALEPVPEAKPMARTAKTAPPAHATKMASISPPTKMLHVTVRPGRYSRSLLPSRGYGVDLGGADSIAVVDAQWAAIKANFGPMLRGMKPTPVRDHQILSGGSYRLVVGHMRSLKAAERLCSHFTSQQVSCQPVEFNDGHVVWR